ncbi:MAG: glutamate--tRNA ligase [Actinobacteria bacterium]|nr:glutamate--tRNA ligase [Actinomycetota bacterium]MBW3650350.1 glutamate--tRNA ligase [Actinomycetota bacterium]
MSPPPIVRFSPSPTGMFHVGGARTALFNWLFARQNKGSFFLRVEDTDQARNRPEWIEGIYAALRWLGLDWDGEPVFQSANAPRHREAAVELHSQGWAYYCGCTAEEVQARNAAAGVKTPGYDGHCRDLDLDAGPGRALRFRTPDHGSLRRTDVIRGTAEIELSSIEDFVILRATGSPTFIMANAFDDLDQGITHVIRGEEHLPNVPKAMLLRDAMGDTDPPVWAHVPNIVNDKRQKLSKRRDKVALEMYRDEGILPEAMRNYLGTLGWAPPGDQEIVPLETMLETFRLEDVTSSPAAFDQKKLLAFNGHYLRALPREEFVDRALSWYRRTVIDPMAPVIQERGATLPETLSMTDFFLHDVPPMDLDSWDKAMRKAPAAAILTAALAAYADCDWSAAHLHQITEELASGFELSLGKAQAPIRVAVTGRTVGPPLFESLVVLGRERTLGRLRRAQARLEKG